jgi:hypothetical protein
MIERLVAELAGGEERSHDVQLVDGPELRGRQACSSRASAFF